MYGVYLLKCYKPMAKKAIDSGIHGRKNKVLERPIDLTGLYKVPIVDKCPVNTSPPSVRDHIYNLKYF